MSNTESRDTGIGLPVGHELLWYEIQSVLGHGGFGITYLARDKNLGRDVALKEFMPRMWASRQTDYTVKPFASDHEEPYKKGLVSFMKEAQTLAKFKHPNIVQVQTVFEHHGTAYMVMEYEQGESLSNQLKLSEFDASQTRLENLLFPMMDGLQKVHDAGFLHRDIKPSNIYIRGDDSPVLIDFGSSRQTELLNTNDATVLVSQGYTPLEQYSKGFGEQGPWTDIYALAASVYFAVTGKVVVDALHRNATIQMGDSDPVPSFAALAGNTPFSREFVYAIDSALLLNPNERPQSLSQWRAMFEQQSDETVLVTPGAAEISLQPSIEDAVTRVQGVDDSAQVADEPWLDSTDRIDPTIHQVAGSGENTSNSQKPAGLPKAAFVAGLVGLVAVLGGGGYLWMQKTPAPQDVIPQATGATIEALPQPDRAIMVDAPADRIARELQQMSGQLALYTQAIELDENSQQALSGLDSLAERYVLLAKSPTVKHNNSLSEAVAEGIVKSVGVNADNQALIATLVSGSPKLTLDNVQQLLRKSSLSSNEQFNLLNGITELSSEERSLLSSTPEYVALTDNFKTAIIARVQNSDFAMAAMMTKLALQVQPSDKQLIQLQQKLSGGK